MPTSDKPSNYNWGSLPPSLSLSLVRYNTLDYCGKEAKNQMTRCKRSCTNCWKTSISFFGRPLRWWPRKRGCPPQQRWQRGTAMPCDASGILVPSHVCKQCAFHSIAQPICPNTHAAKYAKYTINTKHTLSHTNASFGSIWRARTGKSRQRSLGNWERWLLLTNMHLQWFCWPHDGRRTAGEKISRH